MGIKNLHWYLGYNSLALLTEQERKHWLMKTDKRKQLIDPVTGDQYQGQIDNIGSDIVIETEKMATKHSTLMNLSLVENLRFIFSLEPSAFTYCSQVSNFNFLRITSINYPTDELLEDVDINELAASDVSYKNYRIRFEGVQRVLIPFGGSNSSEDVFPTIWIRTQYVYLELLDDSGSYLRDIRIKFNEGGDLIYFYYPLMESLQTVPIEYYGNEIYRTLAINDNQYIGYPLIWFNISDLMDQGKMGCWAECYKFSPTNRQLVLVGNPGNSTIYTGKVYVGVDGAYDATPSDRPTSEVYITCTPASDDDTFTNSDVDFLIPVKHIITMGDRDLEIYHNGEETKFFMCKNVGWEYVNETTYRVLMSNFDSNCIYNGMNSLTAALTIKFDPNLNAEYTDTVDTGVTGIRANSGNEYSDMYKTYPYDLNKWDGLPEHLKNIDENHVPEHMAIYAIHNTPNYIPEFPDSRQVSALLLDLGVKPDDRFDFYYHYKGISGELPDSTVPRRYLQQVAEHTYAQYVELTKRDPQFEELYPTRIDWIYGAFNSYNDYLSDPPKYQLGSGSYIDDDEDPEVEVPYDDEHPIQKEKYFEEIVRKYIRRAARVMDDYSYPIRDIIYGIKMIEYPDEDDINYIIHCYGYSDEHPGDYHVFSMSKPGLIFNSIGKLSKMDGDWTILFMPDGGVSTDDEVIHIRRVEDAADDGSGHDVQIPSFSFDMYRIDNTDTYGRVYVLSNDDPNYVNNSSTAYPKPERTVARICDIPTSITQLTGISGIAPTSVVDPMYVRTEANFTSDDKDRLYNKLASRWVRPIHERVDGVEPTSDNDYVFTSLEDLRNVDLFYKNDFRYLSNLNPKIDPLVVTAGTIVSGGAGYSRGDIGLIYIGGFAFEYDVENVSKSSGVSSFKVRPVYNTDQSLDQDLPSISLSNFDMRSDGSGYTNTYGTAPKTGKGKGFRCTLFIDNFESYEPIKGDVFNDLFALVRVTSGLWIYEYNTETNRWNRSTQVAEFDAKDPESIYQTITDSYMATVIPRRHTLPVNRYDDGLLNVENLDVLSTTSFVNILDTERSPLKENPTDNDNLIHVDLCKFRCDKFIRLQSTEKTFDAALNVIITEYNKVPADSYLAFRWEDYENDDNLAFYFGFIRRSFNNLIVENDIALIPENELQYPYLFNSNPTTTIVWDVKNVGPMMWTFNPDSRIHEKYIIDPDRRTFYIEKELLTWDKIDIYSANKAEPESLIDSDGKIKYDIYTNSLTGPNVEEHIDQDNIYDQPRFYKIVDRGTDNKYIENLPTGNWTCVFPRVSGFVFENDKTGVNVIPVQMQMVHSSNVVTTSKLYNVDTGFDESQRTIIFEDTADEGVRLRVFNSETSTWDTV